ncbi:hypothetical protein C8F04DRAFT_1173096 [Mycena alexandri]|uniref:Uncharacterized protein n=1 Tax=Mycena alexandri TaxID=1745969 RepID=A0AAD6TJI2_9AGAR|nr:hypothetical protein C8F04DRAFT_1173096 [Mycena alexandri]
MSKHHTRAATRSGVYPAPEPLFSPTNRLSFGSVDAGDLLDMTNPAIDPSMSQPAAAAVGMTPASAVGNSVTPVARTPVVSDTGENSSELPSLLNGSVDFGVLGNVPAPPENEETRGWTPVTRKTSRSHREHKSKKSQRTNSSDSSSSSDESTVDQAIRDMSYDERIALALRHESYAAQLRGETERPETPCSTQEKEHSDVESDVQIPRGRAPEERGSAKEPERGPSAVPSGRNTLKGLHYVHGWNGKMLAKVR